MSWELFKQNVERKLCDASKVPSIEYVAEVYATEYDLCIKRGGTIPDRIPILKGNVEGMKTAFIAALKKGLTYKGPYDLTGAMGAGVKIYWTQAPMITPTPPLITPTQAAAGIVANVTATSNVVTNPGIWKDTNIGAPPEKTYDTKKKLEEDDSDVVNNKVNEKETDAQEKKMPPLDANYNLHKIPDNLNNYRSNQIPVRIKPDGTLEGPYPEIIKKYGIKTIIRMNGDGSDGRASRKWPITTIDTERKMCEILGCTFYYINAHGPIEPGNGYQQTNKKIVEILKKGNALIHCAHGADRTGGHVGGYLKKMGIMTDIDQIWDYTVSKNSWMYYIKQGKFFGSGYDKYANIFYPENLLNKKFENGVKEKTKPDVTQKKDDPNAKKILIVGDSISVDKFSTWAYQWKQNASKDNKEVVEILAIGGKQLTVWMKPQLEAKLKTSKYDKVYILGGVNDSWSGKKAEKILTDLQSMVNTVVATGAKAIVVTGYDALKDMDVKKMPYDDAKIDIPSLTEYQRFQSLIAGTIKGATIVPKISVGVLSDGFHPSPKQATILLNNIQKY